jgi:hypothetical protein
MIAKGERLVNGKTMRNSGRAKDIVKEVVNHDFSTPNPKPAPDQRMAINNNAFDKRWNNVHGKRQKQRKADQGSMYLYDGKSEHVPADVKAVNDAREKAVKKARRASRVTTRKAAS